MLFTLDIKQGETREITGEGRFLNVLSASAGEVKINASWQGSNVLNTKMLAGDAVELNRKADRLYISAPGADSVAVIWYSDSKLNNNGVTVKAAGAMRTSGRLVNGTAKLNQITGQNQQIKITSDKAILLAEAGGVGYPIKADTEQTLNLSGDIYAIKPALESSFDALASYSRVLSAAQGYSIVDRLQGNDINLMLLDSAGNSNPKKILRNGVVENIASFTAVVAGAPTTFTADKCQVHFNGAAFYVLCVLARTSGRRLALLKTLDFKKYTQVWQYEWATDDELYVAEPGAQYVGFAVDEDSQKMLLSTGQSSGGAGTVADFLLVNLTTQQRQKWRIDNSQARADYNKIVAAGGVFYSYGASSTYIYKTDSNGTVNVPGVTTPLLSSSYPESCFFPWGSKAIILGASGYSEIDPQGGVINRSLTSSVFSSGYGCIAGDAIYVNVVSDVKRLDLLTRQVIVKAKTGVTAGNSRNIRIVKDGAEHSILSNLYGADEPNQGLFKEQLTTFAGDLIPAKVSIMELF